MKKILAAAAAVALLATAGCAAVGPPTPETVGNSITSVDVRTSTGKTVTCVVYDGPSYAGGLSCDWEHTR